MTQTQGHIVFNKSTGLVEVSCDIMFDETNGSQVEQVDLDELDDEEPPCVALRNMSIGDVCPKESEEPTQAQDQPSSSMQPSPPTQDEDQAQDDEDEEAPCIALRNMSIGDVCPKESEEPTQAQDQTSSSMQPSPQTQDKDQAQDDEDEDQEDEPSQEEDMDQGGDEDNQDKEDEQEIRDQRPPHPRVHQAIQRNHPINSILGDIHKGVTTRSRVAHFYEHYSFVSSIEPYRIEDALRDPDWVVAMQEELNNFTRNEV
jgi:hypothetical protein